MSRRRESGVHLFFGFSGWAGPQAAGEAFDDTGQHGGAGDQRGKLDVLILGVKAPAHRAQAVQNGNPHGRQIVSVRPPSGPGVRKRDARIRGDPACRLEKRLGVRRGFQGRAPARLLEGDSGSTIERCRSPSSDLMCMFAAHRTAMLPSASMPRAGRLSSCEYATNCRPEPAAASRITPAGRTVGSIRLARASATYHGVESLRMFSVMWKDGSPRRTDSASARFLASFASCAEGFRAVCRLPSSTSSPPSTWSSHFREFTRKSGPCRPSTQNAAKHPAIHDPHCFRRRWEGAVEWYG